MFVGVGIVEIYIADSRSLKDKRGAVKSLMRRTQNEFNISIAEVGANDDWKRGEIGFCVVGNDQRFVNSKLDKVLRFMEGLYLVEIVGSRFEITSFVDTVETMGRRVAEFDEFQEV